MRGLTPYAFTLLTTLLASWTHAQDPGASPFERAYDLLESHAYREVVDIATSELNAAAADSSLERAEWLMLRGRARFELDEIGPAHEDLEKSIAIYRHRDPDDKKLIDPLIGLGGIAAAETRFALADSLYSDAVRIASVPPVDSLLLAGALVSRSDLLVAAGRPREAASTLERVLVFAVRMPELPRGDLARYWARYGIACYSSGDLVRAEDANRRALTLLEALYGPDDPDVGAAYSNLATDLISLGDGDRARQCLERALLIEKKVKGPRSASVAKILYNLAVIEYGVGNYARAAELGNQALAIAIEVSGPASVDARKMYGIRGSARDRLGDPDAAESDLRTALAIADSSLGTTHPQAVSDANNLALCLARHGRPEEALRLLQPRLDRMVQAGGSAASSSIVFRANLAIFFLQLHRPKEAWKEAALSSAASLDAFRQVAGTLSERRALLYAGAMDRSIDILVSIAASDPKIERSRVDSTFMFVSAARGRVLDAMVERGQIETADVPDTLRRAVQAARADLSDLVLRGPRRMKLAEYASALERARWRKDDAESRLARASVSFAAWVQTCDRAGILDPGEIAADLPPGAAAVEYVRYSDWAHAKSSDMSDRPMRDIAFVLRRGNPAGAQVDMVSLTPSDVTDSLVATYRREVEASSADAVGFREAARDLASAVWWPVEQILGRADLTFVLPAGSLHFIDFETLLTSDDRFLIESRRLHCLTSLSDLARFREAEAPSLARDRALLLADPDFDAQRAPPALQADVALATRAVTLPCDRALHADPLPGTRAEMDRLRSTLSGAGIVQIDVLSGEQATEEGFIRMAPGARFLHLATHGFFFSESCAGQEGSGAEDGSDLPSFVRREDPLLLSGVLLAGSNGALSDPARRIGGSDGRLTAEEISTADLRSARWVVLSACDTGIGESGAYEGVMGLQRAIELAGARTSILTLWKIPDATTPELMQDLYRRRLGGSSTVDALRGAELAALARARLDWLSDHPRLWAGLVATGDWR